ncbi:oligosaccharide flippase family protein [Phytoactinopolyspora halotolerans]|uniref:Oligosaccharide flippase family protein n=1 Tax=Phytoactinopolyspora halotolerans TaxID=1981512 RepID=A0A6L9S6B1_9ACTN|nr:oligosaccharide flippase family protein [Phytoactinopolyspora halotolerans]NEE00184.1 oligosaccharide flippase family protein [Phytoactinopolyspora halotolerans]
MRLVVDTGLRRFGRTVARTSVCNAATVGAAGLAGIVVARALGPSVRGEYAAIMAWFGVVLVIGQLGQTAATTFFVARERDRAAEYVSTSRNLMVASGVLTLGIGMVVAPLLSSGSGAATAGYRLMFATCLISFVGASYVFSLQATNLAWWNVVRMTQPVAYVTILAALHLAGQLELMTVLAVLSGTTVAQTVLAYWLCAREGLTGARGRRALTRPLLRFGMGHVASTAPTLITTRLGMLVLSLVVPSAALGHYAVAVSVTALAVPVVSAVGNVSFPRIASRTLSQTRLDTLQRWAVLSGLVVSAVLMLPVVATAPWLVPRVFGEGFDDAVPLIMLLAPGGVLLAWGRVCADLLKGHGRPYAVARAQTIAAGVTIVMLAALIPPFGTTGAAVTASVTPGIAVVFMLRSLRRGTRRHEHPVAEGAR